MPGLKSKPAQRKYFFALIWMRKTNIRKKNNTQTAASILHIARLLFPLFIGFLSHFFVDFGSLYIVSKA